MRPELTSIELFAGIAGFTSPHIRPLAFVEKEPTCRAVIRRHHPHALILDDVRTAGAHNLPWVNVLKFGFPCQDLSVAGARAGLKGARSGLFYEATRIADELRPDFLVWENVPGLLSSGAGRDFLAVLTELDRIGYCGGWTTLDAQFFGVAQRRQRVFGVFARRDIGAARCAEILSLAARLPWNPETRREARAGAARSVTASAGHHGHSSPRGDGSDNLVAEPYTIDWQAGSSGDTSFRGKSRAWITDKPGRARALTANRTLAVFGGNDTSGARDVAAALNAHGGTGRHDFESENFVVPSVSPTLGTESYSPTKSSSGQMIDFTIGSPFGVRRLTPRECERLQGFSEIHERMVIDVCLDHRNNSATVAILNLKSQERAGLAERTELPAPVLSAELPSTLRSRWVNKPARPTVLINCEGDSVAIHSQEKLLLRVSSAEMFNPYPLPMRVEDFVRLLAGVRLTADRITNAGAVVSLMSESFLILHESGNTLLSMSGTEIMQRVSAALNGSITSDKPMKSITYDLSDMHSTALNLITSFCFALSATIGYIPMAIRESNSFRIDLNLYSDYTAWGIDETGVRVEMSDSVRYRMLGNAVCKRVSAWLDAQIVRCAPRAAAATQEAGG